MTCSRIMKAFIMIFVVAIILEFSLVSGQAAGAAATNSTNSTSETKKQLRRFFLDTAICMKRVQIEVLREIEHLYLWFADRVLDLFKAKPKTWLHY